MALVPYEKAVVTQKVSLPGGGTQEVRKFADSGIQSSIDKALTGVTAKSATLQVEKNPTGLNAVIAAQLNGHWSVAAAWRRDDWGDSYASKVKFSW